MERDDGEDREGPDPVQPLEMAKRGSGASCVSVRAHAPPQITAGTPRQRDTPGCVPGVLYDPPPRPGPVRPVQMTVTC